MFDHQIVHPYPLTIKSQLTTARPAFPPPPNVALPIDLPVQLGYKDTEKASVWGPTCDSIDCVRSVVRLPQGLEVGDWLAWGEMGAYTLCAASTFNGYVSSYHMRGLTDEQIRKISRLMDYWRYQPTLGSCSSYTRFIRRSSISEMTSLTPQYTKEKFCS
jgi:hypothetical protein